MAKQNRIHTIDELEKIRGSKIISYITGDRIGFPRGVTPDLATQIAPDIYRPFFDHLENIGEVDKIDLFLYSRGGDTNVPYRLVSLIREYCDKFSILVPMNCHSAATMICLGGDKIVMGKLASLSPVDPTTVNVFNPIDPQNPSGRWPISVEDVTAYFNLAKNIADLNTEESVQGVFKALTDKVNPMALGNVQRTYNLIRMLVPKLLSLHIDITKVENQEKVNRITQILTETLYTHSYPICRNEAKKILESSVEIPDSTLESKMWELFCTYEADLKLQTPFNPIQLINTSNTFSEETGYIESTVLTHGFFVEGELIPAPTMQQIQQMLQNLPPQQFAQLVPRLIQLVIQLALNPPSVKFTNQEWRIIP